ncbi:TetR/AcrR family transcriptional regulator [Kiloniella antarctica]|uniref:TetR/AcrR family transcriptional regulator n=1 Tax=Kiloniella antarctica TaxID=1550907 RepID=A0ABW5BKS4_9PROT
MTKNNCILGSLGRRADKKKKTTCSDSSVKHLGWDKDKCLFATLGQKLTRSEQKRNDIRDAAIEVFMNQGFETASMDQIAALAGVSKRTVYSHYGSKEELFAQIMNNICEIKREELDVKPDHNLPIRECLIKLGNTFLDMLHYHGSISLFRILISHAESDPTHGIAFMDEGPKVSRELLAAYLEEKIAAGEIDVADPQEAAQSFYASLFGARYLNCLVTAAPPPSHEEIAKLVEDTVERFIYGLKLKS